jgi:hypothetical protein
MTRTVVSSWAGFVLLLLTAPVGARQDVPASELEKIDFFERQIRPVLVERCFKCHSAEADKVKGNFRLDSREALLKGGKAGPAITVGDPGKSRLIAAIRRIDEESAMPPKVKDHLSSGQIANFETWIKAGLPYPDKKVNKPGPSVDISKARSFWSYRPVVLPPLPAVADKAWPKTTVDTFILARLEAMGIKPAQDADRRTFIRRVTFDLTGLPPTPEDVDSFLSDVSPNADAQLVDRLLTSPRYGEHWGRHWLDVARYADTAGDGSDYPIPQAYRYRNYVIDAFNRDKPYDQFIREQVAGDLLSAESEAERYQHIIATGFITMARRSGEDPDKEHHITIDDTIDTLGSAVLGLNLGCARCHDHKFDPIPKEDYYALYGIFQSSRYPYAGSDHKKYQRNFVPLLPKEEAEKVALPFDRKLAALEAELIPLAEEAAEFEKALGGILEEGSSKGRRTVKELKDAFGAAEKRCNEFAKTRPDYPDAYAMSEGNPGSARVHLSGNPQKLGDEVPRGFLQILGGQKLQDGEIGSGRRQLADWLTDPRNPLTARVMVNRIWQYHFGKGLVGTPNVFGKRGMAPTHPELLDFLAARFVESGWSVKAMHRLIVLSHAYRLSSRDEPASARIDPSNELRWRFDRRRLEAEAVRDSLLAAGGKLSLEIEGAHPLPHRKDWSYNEVTPFRADFNLKQNCRSVYLLQPRLEKHPFLALFDLADTNQSVGKRFESTTSIQALFMMNHPFVHEQARELASRLYQSGLGARERLVLAHRLLYGRLPTPEEVREGLEFVRRIEVFLPDAPEAGQIPRQKDMLVPTAHEDPVLWKYTVAKPEEDWVQAAFKTSGWKEGSAGFAPEKVIREPLFMVRTVWHSPEIWMRRTFRLPDRPLGALRLRVYHDGDTEVYLNGVLAAELKGQINAFGYFAISEEARATLKSGENILAVHCAKTGKAQFIDVGLVEHAAPAFEGIAAWSSYLRVLMSSNEFMYVD